MEPLLYKGQTLLDIKLDTGYDLSNATVKIRYKKPSALKGEWTDVIKEGTKVVYHVKEGDINEAGLWKFQAVVTVGGRTATGSTHDEYFGEPI